jgi:hypothetical protein
MKRNERNDGTNERNKEERNNDERNNVERKEERKGESEGKITPKKEKIDWAAQYGLSDLVSNRRKTEGFLVGITCFEEQVAIDIFRSPCLESRLPDEDGFDAIDLMFSGKLSITRSDDGMIQNWRALVNPVSMHHPNHFGPERGLVIADMIRLLSLELIAVEETFRKHFYYGNGN